MKVLFVLFALVPLVWGAEFQTIAKANQSYISNKIINKIEHIRDKMPCGFPVFDIPPLAPFQTAHQEINIDHKNFQAFVEVSNFSLYGLNDFEINKLTINRRLRWISFEFHWNNISLFTHYNVSTAMNGKGLNKNGTAHFAVKNFTVWGDLKYDFSQELTIKKLNVYFSLGEVKSEIDGLSEKNVINQKLNRIIEDWIKTIVNQNSDKIAELINSILLPRLNDILSEKTLFELWLMSWVIERGTCIPPKQALD